MTLKEQLDRARYAFCVEAVYQHQQNKSAAARALGIHRNTLGKILKGKPC